MNYLNNRPKTIFCDIDGTLVEHYVPSVTTSPEHKMIVLEGTREKIEEWNFKGYCIILTTGRKECSRPQTVKQLAEAGIIYDQLIMGINGGERILINDKKPDGSIAAQCINLDRNSGIKNIDL
jgi:hydroxymethylpyrimidine pyrophosphatase-like HAD family hydrolase